MALCRMDKVVVIGGGMGKGIDSRWGATSSGVVGPRRGCGYRYGHQIAM